MQTEALPAPRLAGNHAIRVVMDKYGYLQNITNQCRGDTTIVRTEALKNVTRDVGSVTLISVKQISIFIGAYRVDQFLFFNEAGFFPMEPFYSRRGIFRI